MTNNEEHYAPIFENNPLKIGAIGISIISLLVVNVFLYGIVWYERFGNHQVRTLLNQLVASMCWYAMAYSMISQVLEHFWMTLEHFINCSLFNWFSSQLTFSCLCMDTCPIGFAICQFLSSDFALAAWPWLWTLQLSSGKRFILWHILSLIVVSHILSGTFSYSTSKIQWL